jgi:hypothetical protein
MYYWGVTLTLRSLHLFFEVSVWHWSQYVATPFWLVYLQKYREEWPVLSEALASLAAEVPPRLLTRRDGGAPMIPLRIPTGVEKHDVVAALCEQIRGIAELLPLDTNTVPEPAPPSEGTVSTVSESAKTSP